MLLTEETMLLTAENCDLQTLVQRGEHFTRGAWASLNPSAYLDSQGIDLAMACKVMPTKPVVWARLRASPGRYNFWKLYAWTDDTGLIEAASWTDQGICMIRGAQPQIHCPDLYKVPVTLAQTPLARFHLAKMFFPRPETQP